MKRVTLPDALAEAETMADRGKTKPVHTAMNPSASLVRWSLML
jgi:hypothetical protein